MRDPQYEADALQAAVDADTGRRNAQIERSLDETVERIARRNQRAARDPRGAGLGGLARGIAAGSSLAERWTRLKQSSGASSLPLPLTDEAGFAGAFDDAAALIPSSRRVKRSRQRINTEAALRVIERSRAPGLEPLPARAADRSRRAPDAIRGRTGVPR